MILETPVKLRLEEFDGADLKALEKELTYINKATQYELTRLKKNPYYVNQHGEEKYREELARLKQEMTVCLVKNDRNGIWTYSGLAQRIQERFKVPLINQIKYPEPKLVPWSKVPDGTDRYYQKFMHDNLLKVRHGSVEVGTGLGKSRVIRNLTKSLSLKTLVIAPSKSIARQLHKDFVKHFGKKRVGKFGDGKKESDKLIVVGLFQSLTNVEPGSDHWRELGKTEVLIVDESHLTAASTLKHVCEGIVENAPYRFFFSGTQMRNDGADLLLEGIIGPVVYEMTVQQGVDEGFLSKPNFYMIEMDSSSTYISENYDAMVDRHFYSNKEMYARAADIANKSTSLLGHQVLILIDEVTQFQHIWPHLKAKTGFAHGGVTPTNKKFVPDMFHKSDPEELVDELNKGNLPILVGTGCISIGTDIQTPKTVINLQGGLSEVKIRQAVGRGTRKVEGFKDSFNHFDFCVRTRNPVDSEYQAPQHRHALVRAAIYQDIYPTLKFIK